MGSIYLGIMGFTSRHLSLAERVTTRGCRYPTVLPSSSSVGSGAYSIDDATKSSMSSSSSPWSEVDGGCGRRKKHVRGIVSGRTYATVVIGEVRHQTKRSYGRQSHAYSYTEVSELPPKE